MKKIMNAAKKNPGRKPQIDDRIEELVLLGSSGHLEVERLVVRALADRVPGLLWEPPPENEPKVMCKHGINVLGPQLSLYRS